MYSVYVLGLRTAYSVYVLGLRTAYSVCVLSLADLTDHDSAVTRNLTFSYIQARV
jgi:hypothetical protein